MSPYIGTGPGHGATNGSAEAARADAAKAHARQHLDYQRRVALANLHRHDPGVMRHNRKDDTR